jgi:hypothetical protein
LKSVVPIKTIVPIAPILRRIGSILILILFFRGLSLAQATAMFKFGNSYVNISKGTVGGPVQPGDTLEIRLDFYVNKNYVGTGNTVANKGKMYKVRYYDSLPTYTNILAGSTLNLITNEGVVSRAYTQASDADQGTYSNLAGAGPYQIRINMGAGSSAPAGLLPMSIGNTTGAGTITGGTTTPLFSAGSIITTAFRVVVTGGYGDTITLGGGIIAFRTNATAATDTFLTASRYQILITPPTTLCANGSSVNFAAEFQGTFGTGIGRNRAAPPTFLIPGYIYQPNSGQGAPVAPTQPTINDGMYAIVNNISPTSSTFTNANRQPACGAITTGPTACANREFNGFWFISGDHTGTNNAAGNPPPDSNTNAGYMLVVNADLATSEAYHQVISGLCPNTYYQFSVWVKNICPNCGIDSNGVAEYTPGVLPNLALSVDGIDRLTTGRLDTVGWQQRGFVFLTGPAETSITISVRNNACGGGGNDWALDDITLATCPPNILLTPNKPDTLCQGADDTVRFAISSFVNNYTQYQLMQSTDGGVTWVTPPLDTLGRTASGSVVPVWNAGLGLYVDTVTRYYRILPTNTQIIYRLTVASTVANLSSSTCSFTTTQPKTVVGVNCMVALPTTLLSFNGKVTGGLGQLQWVSSNEIDGLSYSVERSDDGTNFTSIATIPATAGTGNGAAYQFTDPTPVGIQTYYRIGLVAQSLHLFSKLVLLSNTSISFQIRSVVNPFTDHISVDMTSSGNGTAVVTLVDLYGRMIRREMQPVTQGFNTITMYSLSGLPAATYVMQIQYNDQMVSKKLVKVNLQ